MKKSARCSLVVARAMLETLTEVKDILSVGGGLVAVDEEAEEDVLGAQ